MTQRFRSSIDAKVVAMGVGVPTSLALVFITNGVLFGAPPWWALLPLLVAVAISVWLLASTSYAFEGAMLLVRCGPLRWRIPLEQIFAVNETDSLRSAPAMSMDRLEIRFADDDRMLVSPRDKTGFLTELRRRAPQLGNQGGSARAAV